MSHRSLRSGRKELASEMTRGKKRKNPNSADVETSAEIVASVDDLLIEILIRLPLKPLFRFKLVSKHWLSLISCHKFYLLRNPAPNRTRGIFLGFSSDLRYKHKYVSLYPETPDSHTPSLDFDFTTAPSRTVILHSCNGLLLCCSSIIWDGTIPAIITQPDCKLYVYNPTIKCFAIIPHFVSELPQGTSLVCDPCTSPHYKVVLAERLTSNSNKIHVQVYSSETGVWTSGGQIEESRVENVNFEHSGVYWNGSIHWRNLVLSPEKSGFLLRYHVDSQVFYEMPLPPLLKQNQWSDFYFGVSCDHFHFVEPLHFVDPFKFQFNVYEMKKDYSEWFVKYQVDLRNSFSRFPQVFRIGMNDRFYCVGYIVSVIRGDDDDSSMLVLRIPGNKVLKCNLVDRTLQELANVDEELISARYRMGTNEVEFTFDHEEGSDYIESICSV